MNSGEGAPHLVTERLRRLPSALRVDDVRLGVNNAGQEVVVVQGRLRSFLVSRGFVYTLAVTVRPDSDPGRPADVLAAEPAGPGSSAGASLGAHTEALDRAICEGVKQALEAGCTFVASAQLELADAGFPATIVSVTEVELLPSVSDPSLSAKVHAGANLGGGGGVLDPG